MAANSQAAIKESERVRLADNHRSPARNQPRMDPLTISRGSVSADHKDSTRAAARGQFVRDVAKRGLDIVASACGLLVLSPLLVTVAIAIRLDSNGPVLFRQKRVGRSFRQFSIIKFRTMVPDSPRLGPPITIGIDPRITRVGRFLRATKIDELPQLFNVLKGDMSLVGPRPEVPHYVQMFQTDYAVILQVRPGITDPDSIEFRNESALLAEAADPEHEYVAKILPRKLELAKEYVAHASLLLDLRLIMNTLVRLVVR